MLPFDSAGSSTRYRLTPLDASVEHGEDGRVSVFVDTVEAAHPALAAAWTRPHEDDTTGDGCVETRRGRGPVEPHTAANGSRGELALNAETSRV